MTRLAAGLLVSGLAVGLATGCGATPRDQRLGQQTFTYTIPPSGLPTGFTLPPIPCTDVSVCNSFLKASNISLPGLTPMCVANTCAADLKLTILYVIDAVNDPAFTLGIAQSQADSFRDVKMTYGISSTINLKVNQIDVYVGKDGLRSPSDPSSIYLGTVGPVPAMGNIPDGDRGRRLVAFAAASALRGAATQPRRADGPIPLFFPPLGFVGGSALILGARVRRGAAGAGAC